MADSTLPLSGWSYSVSREFDTCPRAFYDSWMDGDGKSQGAEPDQDDVHLLQFAHGTGEAIGITVHRVIGSQIESWAQGQGTSLTEAKSAASRILSELEESLQHQLDHPLLRNESSPVALKEELSHTVETHIERFFQVIWPRFRFHQYICNEETFQFDVDGVPVYVKPDFCTRNEEGILVITDWKTAQHDSFDDQSLQLNIYALWANQALEPDISRLQVQAVHTSSGAVQRQAIDKDSFKLLTDKIVREYTRWTSEDDRDAYPTNPDTDRCSKCRHLANCGDGQRVTNTEV